jgi:hypothetical protein
LRPFRLPQLCQRPSRNKTAHQLRPFPQLALALGKEALSKLQPADASGPVQELSGSYFRSKQMAEEWSRWCRDFIS